MPNLHKPTLTKPQIFGDMNVWGYILNDNIDKTSVFITELMQDLENKDQEISRIEREKVSKSEVIPFIEEKVDNYIELNVKPELDTWIDTVTKPDLDTYISQKKGELDRYVREVKNVELDRYEKEKETEIHQYVSTEIESITNHTTSKITEVTEHTDSEKVRITTFVDTEIQRVKNETDTQIATITDEGKKVINEYVNTTSKPDIDNYVKGKEKELSGATFKPSVSPDGDLSWTNDKNLPNPDTVNLRGDAGNFIFDIEDGRLILYTVDNGKAPNFNLDNNGHLIMEII